MENFFQNPEQSASDKQMGNKKIFTIVSLLPLIAFILVIVIFFVYLQFQPKTSGTLFSFSKSSDFAFVFVGAVIISMVLSIAVASVGIIHTIREKMKGNKIKYFVIFTIVSAIPLIVFGAQFLFTRLHRWPIDSFSESVTTNWLTYRNEQYKFEFKYPPNWEVLNNADGDISLRDTKYAGSFEWPGFRLATSDVPNEFNNAKASNIFRKDDAVNNIIRITLSNGVAIFYASCTLYLDATVLDTCNQILSTFKYIRETSGLKTYRSSVYGFEFSYLSDHTAYTSTDQKNEKLIPAGPNSEYVAIAETEAHVFCCEPLTFSVLVVKDKISPAEWLKNNTNSYDVRTNTSINFAGGSALQSIGRAGIDSEYKIVIISKPTFLLVLRQNAQTEFLDQIISTFKFIK